MQQIWDKPFGLVGYVLIVLQKGADDIAASLDVPPTSGKFPRILYWHVRRRSLRLNDENLPEETCRRHCSPNFWYPGQFESIIFCVRAGELIQPHEMHSE